MTPPPRSVTIGPYKYGIKLVKELGEPEELDGVTDTAGSRLLIKKDLSPSRMRETVMHEILHAIWDVTNLPKAYEEKVIMRLSPILLDTLQRNPEVTSWFRRSEPFAELEDHIRAETS